VKIWNIMLVCGEPSGDLLGAQLMAGLKALAADRVRFCGVGGAAMAREGLQSLFPLDAKGVLLLPKAIAAARKGDDALLRFIVGICEDAGLKAVSVAEAAPGLVTAQGALGLAAPDEMARADIESGFRIVQALGALDVGQAAVVCEGLALAVEAAEGTDAMIARIGTLRETLRGTAAQRRGVLVKALKPTQDAKTDMPVVGVETVRKAHAAFLAGIAVEAGAALILDKSLVRDEADRLGIFIIGVKP
jgi:DUF1009 family protein